MKDTFVWEALEHHHEDKSADWFWSLGIIAVSLTVLCVFFNNVLLGIFILVASFTAALHARKEPRILTVSLTMKGVIVEDKLYRYDTLDSFWIDEQAHIPQIILKSKKVLMPFIIVPIEEHHHDDIRMYLLMHLQEEEHHESPLHHLLEYFGF